MSGAARKPMVSVTSTSLDDPPRHLIRMSHGITHCRRSPVQPGDLSSTVADAPRDLSSTVADPPRDLPSTVVDPPRIAPDGGRSADISPACRVGGSTVVWAFRWTVV